MVVMDVLVIGGLMGKLLTGYHGYLQLPLLPCQLRKKMQHLIGGERGGT